MNPKISAGFKEIQVAAFSGFVRIDFRKAGEIVGFNLPINTVESVARALLWCAVEAERMEGDLTNPEP
jgi:hypothetical protein